MSEEKSRDDILAEMDVYAIEAQNDLVNIDQEALEKVTVWWQKWYLKCGHKRLGRILVKGL
jgi:hypothetical protein